MSSHLPGATGVYLFRDAAGGILYIGKAVDLAKRVAQHFDPARSDPNKAAMLPLVKTVDYAVCRSEREALLLEDRLVKRFQPFFNVLLRDDKTYPWIKLTWGEDFPRLLWTRRRAEDGSLYFGPYPKVSLVRSLLRYLWRARIVPLRPCSYDFSLRKPLDPRKIKSCLYFHTKECTAPCHGDISRQDYRQLASQARLFLSGRYGRLRREFERGMKASSGALKYEQAAEFRDRLKALDHLQERVALREVAEADLAERLSGTRAITALQRDLGLDRPPVHIEAADISHSQGRETVGSFVCFMAGAPNRDHYRRLKVRTVAGIDDFASMREVVGRRVRGLKAAGEPLPDLLLIDGGKGQLSAALEALRAEKARVPAAGLAKREEEVFLPGRGGALRFDRASESLRLLQRLRDEAHRFAVAYHRHLRGKRMIEERP